MAKQRQARRCSARRSTDGQPCQGWAVVGGTVCAAHGGSAPQVRAAYDEAHVRARVERAMAEAYGRYRRERQEWQIRRVAVTAQLLGIEPAAVTWADILACRVVHGQPAEPEPQIRVDRRRLRGLL